MLGTLKLNQTVEKRVVPWRNNVKEMQKQKCHTEIMIHFHKVSPSVSAFLAFFSTSSSSAYSTERLQGG